MKISYSPYQLEPRQSLNAKSSSAPREGALIRWEDQGQVGYADLFPWPELGDAPLSEHIQSLKSGHPSSLAQQSCALARKDAEARTRGVALGGSHRLRNNALVPDLNSVSLLDLERWWESGFRSLKIKCGRDPQGEAATLVRWLSHRKFQLRLDFNAGSVRDLEQFVEAFPSRWDSHIQYVEDPCDFDEEVWKALSERWDLAVDFEWDKMKSLSEPPVKVVILKPARQNVDEVISWVSERKLSVVVTSGMDHPVGVAHALSVALDLEQTPGLRTLEGGCLTLDVYHESEFSAAFARQGPEMGMPSGTGIGFDELLEKQKWISI